MAVVKSSYFSGFCCGSCKLLLVSNCQELSLCMGVCIILTESTCGQKVSELSQIFPLCLQIGGLQAERAAGFLGACLPAGAFPSAFSSAPLRGSGGLALNRLAAEGLAWAPTVGNLATLLCFALALALNAQLTQVSGIHCL